MSKGKTKPTTKKPVARNRKKAVPTKPIAVQDVAEIADVKKSREFQMFFVWQSLPPVFRGKPKEYIEKLGINDEEVLELLAIKTLGQFAEIYKVRAATLTEWKKKIREKGLVDESKEFFKNLSHNVYAAFYDATLRHGDAQRVRLFEEIFNEKLPEGSIPQTPELLGGVQFNQVIINLKSKYSSELKQIYVDTIKENSKDVQSPKRVRPNPPEGEGD